MNASNLTPSVLAAAGELGDGVIDNIVVRPVVHLIVGSLVIISFVVFAAWMIKALIQRRPWDRTSLILLGACEVILAVQVLIGVKLLDQGEGIFQLFIHYAGGLLPIAIFVVAGWIDFGDAVKKTRAYAVCALVSLGIILMTYFIGEAYANRAV